MFKTPKIQIRNFIRIATYNFFIFTLLCLFSINLIGNDEEVDDKDIKDLKKNKELKFITKKRPWISFGEIVGLNIGVCVFNKYIAKEDFANISWKSIKENFNHGFGFDIDNFQMNFLFHPFHGNLYFNSARANGMNFWESIPYTVFGSLMWEMTMENTYPAGNDLIMTTSGGIMLGETLYRLSSHILDDSKTGVERTIREILAAIINPVRAFNRLVRGETNEINPNNSFNRAKIRGILTLGGRGILKGFHGTSKKTSPLIDFHLIYGEPFKGNEKQKPFDFFVLKTLFMPQKKNKAFDLLDYALLSGKSIKDRFDFKHLIGFFQYFDFIKNEAISIGSSAIGGGIISEYPLSTSTKISTSTHIGAMLMGATNTEYFKEEERDYNFCTGYILKFDATITNKKLGTLLIELNNYRTYIINGIKGNERLYVSKLTYSLPIAKGWGLGLSYFRYHRKSYYKKFNNVKKRIRGIRGFISYQF